MPAWYSGGMVPRTLASLVVPFTLALPGIPTIIPSGRPGGVTSTRRIPY
jgi:hypothetical protein